MGGAGKRQKAKSAERERESTDKKREQDERPEEKERTAQLLKAGSFLSHHLKSRWASLSEFSLFHPTSQTDKDSLGEQGCWAWSKAEAAQTFQLTENMSQNHVGPARWEDLSKKAVKPPKQKVNTTNKEEEKKYWDKRWKQHKQQRSRVLHTQRALTIQ